MPDAEPLHGGTTRTAGCGHPRGRELEFLPPYSPELQPAEHLWPLTDEGIANTLFAALDEPQEVPANRPELFSSATL